MEEFVIYFKDVFSNCWYVETDYTYTDVLGDGCVWSESENEVVEIVKKLNDQKQSKHEKYSYERL